VEVAEGVGEGEGTEEGVKRAVEGDPTEIPGDDAGRVGVVGVC